MKIAFLSPSLSRIAGGIFEVERDLALALGALPDTEVSAYGVADRETDNDRAAWRQIPLHVGALKGPMGFGYSPEMRDAFAANDADVAHLQVMWMYTSIVARDWGRRTGKPYVTTAHGMLDPWARQNSGVKKQFAALVYERSALRQAGCLHVMTPAELDSAREWGVKGPFCLVTNGVRLPAKTALADAPPAVRAIKAAGEKFLFFIGRLHPKKNLVKTLEAFIRIAPAHPEWHFVIAGWGVEAYGAQLQAMARDAGLAARVHFTGPLYADAKAAALAAADAFVLASLSEGVPMSVLEAFANRVPVAMTRACNLPAGFDAGAAIAIGPETADIAAGLSDLFAMPETERSAMGSRGRALVEDGFTWDKVALQMRAVYGWLLGGERPDWVIL
ncbi:glycosyltransferase [Sphingomonas immobilis]|uniref:Glycosyltransferase n=1 Tax=Sphingomonas immobilis TaxID=3063997 RepID=A0ABT8ZWS0_9SPHN|nr:glycosyltransferase [Sphingomonas sp. CA1-15]MDO7840922.1 glycosyltransferase [Sphingomonas sp. CA1-15]